MGSPGKWGGGDEFQLSGAELKYFLGHFLRGKKKKFDILGEEK